MNTLQAIGIIVGVVSGVSGLVWSFVNWWEHRVSTRPRIVVRPRFYCVIDDKDGKPVAAYVAVIEICNVGQMPVVGSTVGFLSAWTVVRLLPRRMRKGRLGRLLQRQQPAYAVSFSKQEPLHKGLEWQREVGPQHIASVRFEPGVVPLDRKIGRAFAATAVGNTFKASRRDMRIFLKQYKKLWQEDDVVTRDVATTGDHGSSEDAL